MTAPLRAERTPTIDVEVVLATRERQQLVALAVPLGCTAREAVGRARSAGLDTGAVPDLDAERGPLGIYGERVADDRVLGAGDRVELYRPLAQDPRERRRRLAAAAKAGPGPDASASARARHPSGRA